MDGFRTIVPIAVIGAVVVLWLMFSSMPAPQEEAHKEAPVPEQVRVISDYYTIPARGRLEIQMKMRCTAHGFTEDEKQYVKREQVQDTLIYTSTADSPITRKVYFYDEGGDCVSDFEKLKAQRAFK